MTADPAVANLVAAMGTELPAQVGAYGYLSRAVKMFLDGEASRAELERDLSICETALTVAAAR